MASVCSERMMHISSATSASRGKTLEICWPDWPQRTNGCCGARQVSFAFCNCAIGCPVVNDSGMGWPLISASLGL